MRGMRSMKILAVVFAIALLICGWSSYSAGEQSKKKKSTAGQELYSSVWKKVSPTTTKRSSGSATAVAGLRGDEKEKFFKPYWKGAKKTESPDVEAFREAGKLIEANKFEEACQALLDFISKFPKSALLPKVKIALALCYIHLGKKDEAGKVLSKWLEEYPNNELASDVKAILADLKK